MSILENKSEINFDAAKKLHEQSLYPSVIHCAYYSCIQQMKHIWLNKMGKTEGDLKIENDNSNFGSHEVLINQIKNYVKDKKTFNTNILLLKRKRVDADYLEVSIDYSISKNSIDLAQTVLNELKK